MTSAQDGSRYRVAVDAMGGDHAPEEIVRGALDAAARGNVDILLVGEAEALSSMLPSPASGCAHACSVPRGDS